MKSEKDYLDELSDPVRMRTKPDLADIMIMGATGAIEAQEKRGQEAFVNTQSLPIEIRNGTRADLESLGFRFGADIDDLFVEAILPPRWTKRSSDHDMWSYIQDEQGRDRIAVFYKAAFYDRRAHLSINQRFRCTTLFLDADQKPTFSTYQYIQHVVRDAESKVVFSTPLIPKEKDTYDAPEEAECEKWLKENYPDHKNPLAYW